MTPLTIEARSESLIEALPYIQRFRGHTFVIKYGGAAMEDEGTVEKFLRDVVFLEAVGINPVLVHGGGKAITSRMRHAGLKTQFVNGLRVTNSETIRIVEETLDQEINPSIVRTIQDFGGKARGFSGKNIFIARRLPLQPLDSGEPIDIGFVGEVAEIKADAISDTISKEIIPVISPIGATNDSTVLNINADMAASALAAKLKATKLIFVSDVPGIMRDPSEKDSLISTVTTGQVESLIKQKVIAGGMIPKVQSAVLALSKGVQKIHFIGGHTPHCLLLEILTDDGVGSEIVS